MLVPKTLDNEIGLFCQKSWQNNKTFESYCNVSCVDIILYYNPRQLSGFSISIRIYKVFQNI